MPDNKNKLILIVEDEQDIITYLTTIFEDAGYRVETATNGIDALRKIKKYKPDLISLDIALPEKTGMNIYLEIKKNTALSSIPVVIISGMQKDIQHIFEEKDNLPPPNGYINKPFCVEELKTIVGEIIK